jgi:hypothetical protein
MLMNRRARRNFKEAGPSEKKAKSKKIVQVYSSEVDASD